MTATIVLSLCDFRKGSNEERVYLDVFGPGLDMPSIDITERMGKTVTYRIPSDMVHAYRVSIYRGPNVPPQTYQPTANFKVPGAQQKLPITQFVSDAMCTTVV